LGKGNLVDSLSLPNQLLINKKIKAINKVNKSRIPIWFGIFLLSEPQAKNMRVLLVFPIDFMRFLENRKARTNI
jgi:hypothetical protein